MSQVWVGNFAFEDQLIGKETQNSTTLRFEAELAPLLAGAAAPEDLVLCPRPVTEDFRQRLTPICGELPRFIALEELMNRHPKSLTIQPWGWSPWIHRIFSQLGVQQAPSLEAVRNANSRMTTQSLARDLNVLQRGECLISSVSEFAEAIQGEAFAEGYVLKTNFGQSGRGQLHGTQTEPDESTLRWISRRLKHDGFLILEPKLKAVQEFGIQWDIPRRGAPILHGITLLKSDESHGYLGSELGLSAADHPALAEVLIIQEQAAIRLQAIGYWGPVGIDAMVYISKHNEFKARPLQDINARWTMGRLALAWGRRCFSEKTRCCWEVSPDQPQPNAILTSPEIVGGQNVIYKTWCSR